MKTLRYRMLVFWMLIASLISCQNNGQKLDVSIDVGQITLKPTVITEKTPNDTDNPAIWIHPSDPTKSLVIGTDKNINGGLYAYNLEGEIVNKVLNLKRPNNVDVAYGLEWGNGKIDIAVVTEREANSIRIFRLPDLMPMDAGGIKVFEGEVEEDYNEPMGIALYTKITGAATKIYAIVGRKSGPEENIYGSMNFIPIRIKL